MLALRRESCWWFPLNSNSSEVDLTQDLSVAIKQVVADLGFRGKDVDANNPRVQIIHRGRHKSLSPQEQRWLKRRQAVEPAIGHLKSDHRLDRCWLKGALGDALHAISCAAGYNLRWLLRAIARLGIGPAFLRLLQVALCAVRPRSASCIHVACRIGVAIAPPTTSRPSHLSASGSRCHSVDREASRFCRADWVTHVL